MNVQNAAFHVLARWPGQIDTQMWATNLKFDHKQSTLLPEDYWEPGQF